MVQEIEEYGIIIAVMKCLVITDTFDTMFELDRYL